MPRPHCLVTGGAGFIGSHLVDALLADGCRVTAADNLSTGSLGNLAEARRHPDFRFVELDVADRDGLAPLVAECDELYHLASYVGVRLASQTSSATILGNLRAIDTVLDLAGEYRPRFLLTSTSEVYGKALDSSGAGGLMSEEADRVYGSTEVHRWSYAGTKAIEEHLTLAKHKEEGLHAIIARLFNVIGPRQVGQHGPVVPRFIDQALAGEPITIYGDGRQRRCFTDVADTVRAIVRLMRTPEAAGEVFNVGAAEPVTMRALAEAIVRLTGSDSPLTFIPYEEVYGKRFEDVHDRVPDTSKLTSYTGLTLGHPLDDVLRRSIEVHPRPSRPVV